jgi:hypothetical protein
MAKGVGKDKNAQNNKKSGQNKENSNSLAQNQQEEKKTLSLHISIPHIWR